MTTPTQDPVREALLPCPFCGRKHFDLLDELHPTTRWRDDPAVGFRVYVAPKDARPDDGWCWVMSCAVHNGGCGAEMNADSKEEVIAAWNRRAALAASPARPEAGDAAPFGYVLHWPAIGGGTKEVFSRSRASGDAIACKVTPVYAHPTEAAPAAVQEQTRYREKCPDNGRCLHGCLTGESCHHDLAASKGEAATASGRNMFYEGRFDGETERQQSARLRWANDMRAAFERHTGNGWFDKDWYAETGVWAAAWNACLAASKGAAVQGEAPKPPHWGAIHTEASGKVELGPLTFRRYLDDAFNRGVREALARSAPTADPVRQAAQHISAAIEKQLELIRERAPGDYLDKRPVVQALASHKRRLDAALSLPVQSAEPVATEQAMSQLIDERDHRDEIIDQLCDAVLGPDRTEWSSAYHLEDAVAEVLERMEWIDQRLENRASNAPSPSPASTKGGEHG